jgi:hypothetical protein
VVTAVEEEDAKHAVGGVVIAVVIAVMMVVEAAGVVVAAGATAVTAMEPQDEATEPQDGDVPDALALCWMGLLMGVVVLVLGIVDVKEPLRLHSDNQFCVLCFVFCVLCFVFCVS